MGARVTTITLDKDRVLFYSVAATMEAERVMGKSIRDALATTSVSDLVTLLWAGLKHQNPRLKVDDVAGYLDTAKRGPQSVLLMWNSVADALIASGILPEPASQEGAPTDPPIPPDPALGSTSEPANG